MSFSFLFRIKIILNWQLYTQHSKFLVAATYMATVHAYFWWEMWATVMLNRVTGLSCLLFICSLLRCSPAWHCSTCSRCPSMHFPGCSMASWRHGCPSGASNISSIFQTLIQPVTTLALHPINRHLNCHRPVGLFSVLVLYFLGKVAPATSRYCSW